MLRTYLQDHHAGVDRRASSSRAAPRARTQRHEYGAELARIADEIAEDRETLEQVMERLGVKPSTIKDAAGWTAEKFGRLKPNNSLLSYSPLSRVVELEGLVIGVTGKLALWESLRGAVGESLDGIDFAGSRRARRRPARAARAAARARRRRGLRRP